MRVFTTAALSFLLHILTGEVAVAGMPYPLVPSPQLTPGELCAKADAYRYPEGIAYCERSVKKSRKDSIIAAYDRHHGYRIGTMDREMFKIDHYIPLCVGGSNSPKNLWPQHIANFEITDALEKLVCQQMERGRLKQNDAVAIIRRGKNNLQEVPQIMRKLGTL